MHGAVSPSSTLRTTPRSLLCVLGASSVLAFGCTAAYDDSTGGPSGLRAYLEKAVAGTTPTDELFNAYTPQATHKGDLPTDSSDQDTPVARVPDAPNDRNGTAPIVPILPPVATGPQTYALSVFTALSDARDGGILNCGAYAIIGEFSRGGGLARTHAFFMPNPMANAECNLSPMDRRLMGTSLAATPAWRDQVHGKKHGSYFIDASVLPQCTESGPTTCDAGYESQFTDAGLLRLALSYDRSVHAPCATANDVPGVSTNFVARGEIAPGVPQHKLRLLAAQSVPRGSGTLHGRPLNPARADQAHFYGCATFTAPLCPKYVPIYLAQAASVDDLHAQVFEAFKQGYTSRQ